MHPIASFYISIEVYIILYYVILCYIILCYIILHYIVLHPSGHPHIVTMSECHGPRYRHGTADIL